MILNVKKNAKLKVVLLILLFTGIFLLLVWVLVLVEKDSQQSNLTTYSNALWYSFATITTVGYGDLFPGTFYGRVIGFILMLISIFIFGLLIGQLTTLMTTIKEHKKHGFSGTNFKNHAVVIGWNDFGWHVVDQLVGVGRKVAIVTNKKDNVELIKEKYGNKSVYVLFSDYHNYDFIKKSNIEKSAITFINLQDDTEKLVYVLNIKKVFPDTEFVVTLENSDLKDTFLSAGVSNTISIQEISSKLLASYMFEPDVANYSESILSYARTDNDYDIKQLLVSEKNPYAEKKYDDAFFDIKKKYNAVLIGMTKVLENGKKELMKNPDGDTVITHGDYLILILNGESFKNLKNVFGVEEGEVSKK